MIEVAANSQKIRPGTHLGEYKAGAGAFKIDQLEDLAKLWDAGARGFKRAAKDTEVAYKGEIYFFSERDWAVDAEEQIMKNAKTKRLLESDPPGVILMYLDPRTGGFTRYGATELPSAAGPGL